MPSRNQLASAAILVLAAVLGIKLFSPRRPQPAARVFVYGIDGATWDVMEPMIEAGELPTLAEFYRDGTHGILRSHKPAISPVAWSTIFTGRLPRDHQVRSWSTSQSTHRAVKMVWQITSEAGHPSDVFNVPSTWPADPVDGVLVSGFPVRGSHVGGNTGQVVRLEEFEGDELPDLYTDNAEVLTAAMRAQHPGDWSDWLQVAHGRAHGVMTVRALEDSKFWLSPFYRTDDGLVMTYPADLRDEVFRKRLAEEYIPEGPGWDRHDEPETPEYLAEQIADITRIQTDAAKLFIGSDWDLFVYVHTMVDRVSHPYWAYSHPEDYPFVTPELASAYGDAVREAYRVADAHLAELTAEIDGDFTLFIVSDHGFTSNPDRTIGVHDLDGAYLLSGPGIPSGEGEQMILEDVAPTVLYLLHMPSAEDITGKAPEWLVSAMGDPPPPIHTYETTAREVATGPVDPETWEQLKGLGYVEGDAPTNADAPDDTDAD